MYQYTYIQMFQNYEKIEPHLYNTYSKYYINNCINKNRKQKTYI